MAQLIDIVKKGSTNRSVVIRIIDDTSGQPETGVVWNTAGIDLWYRREGGALVSITEASLASLTTAHTDGGFLHVSHGEYRLDLPDAAFATGANHVDIGGTVTGMVVIGGRVRLVDYDPESSTDLGLSSISTLLSRLVGTIAAGTHNAQSGDAYGIVNHGTYGNAALDSDLGILLTRIAQTLNLTASGNIGIDWANVENQSSAVNLSATITNLVNTVTTLTNLPAITAGWLTAAGIAASALNGKGDWNIGKTGYSLASTGLNSITQSETGMIEIAKAVWDRVVSKANHNIAQSAGKYMRQSAELFQLDGSISDASPAIGDFDTNLTGYGDGYFVDGLLLFVNGSANAGAPALPITGYTSATGNFQFATPDQWPITPVDGDDFIIVSLHVHPINQIRDAILADSTAFNGADIALIKAVTDVIPDSGAMTSIAQASALTTVDTVVDAIRTVTDLLPDAGALTSLATAANLSVVDTVVDAIKVVTDSIGIKKNTALNNFTFEMVLSSDHYTAATGKTITGQVSLDGGAYVAVTGTITEIGNGSYQFDADAADTNGDVVTWRFSEGTCDDTKITILTHA